MSRQNQKKKEKKKKKKKHFIPGVNPINKILLENYKQGIIPFVLLWGYIK
jgi:hypothetical protein